MSSIGWTKSPLWTAAGWTMLHFMWVGAVIGLTAAIMRGLLKSTRPETRYVVTLICFAVLSFAPALIFMQVFDDHAGPATAMTRPNGADSTPGDANVFPDHPKHSREALPFRPPTTPPRWHLESLVALLPWLWLCGAVGTQVMVATGLIGVERLRRSSRLVEDSELSRHCRALADSLGIACRVGVGICDRLATPILIGIVRPLILLPPSALCGWNVDQLEMVLLHELAHLRRWDNLVNLLQRFVESLLFFHPVVWSLSGWVRLERELCCDRLVVEQIGRPDAYAEMLLALSGSSQRGRPVILAMADRQVMTRILRLLNLEERSMKLTLPEGLGLAGAMVLGAVTILGSQAAQTKPVQSSEKKGQSVPGTAVDDVKDMPHLDGIVATKRLTRKKNERTGPRVIRVHPANPRTISLFAREEGRLRITQFPKSPDGVITYLCKGGIEIVYHSRKSGTIRLEADEATIKRRVPDQGNGELAGGPRDETWYEEDDLPMEVHLKGNVIARLGGKGEQQTIRASSVDYDFVSDRWFARDAALEVDAPGLGTPIKIWSVQMEMFHTEERQPDGSVIRSERREIRAGPASQPTTGIAPMPSSPKSDPNGPTSLDSRDAPKL